MTYSFRETSLGIDLLYPPLSFRKQAERFRYPDIIPGKLPDGVHISFRPLMDRIQNENVEKIEFLHYNTWLLRDNFKLADIIKFLVGTSGLHCVMTSLGLSVAELIANILGKIGTSGICDKLFPPVFSICGVSINPANDACKLVGPLSNLVAYIVGKLGEAIEGIFDLLCVSLDFVIDAVCYLFAQIHNTDIPLKEMPDVDNRALEIGEEVFKYDIVSLNEVWKQEFRDAILMQEPQLTAFIGPPDPSLGEWEHMGSGILVFSPTYEVLDGGYHQYIRTGVEKGLPGCPLGKLYDADQWSRKGVQLTLINVKYGTIELYSTHLYSGGEMVLKPSDEEKAAVRVEQFNELAEFIRQTHNPKNIAIVAGDFNTETDAVAERRILCDTLGNIQGINFDDWYAITPFLEVEQRVNGIDDGLIGHTNRDSNQSSFDSICRIFPSKKPGNVKYDYYCDETIKPSAPTGNRLDYIFIQRPLSSQTFILDVSRIRRRAFKRLHGDGDNANYLSDHLGLEVTLYANSKNKQHI